MGGSLARGLEQFDWGVVTHDVMKTIYESVITVETPASAR